MIGRDRVVTAMNRKEPDRVPVNDSPWKSALARWRKEGLPEDVDCREYFGYEFASFGADLSPRFPSRVLEKNETHITETTVFGGVRRNFRDFSSTPEVIDWPVKSKERWSRLKKRLAPDYKRIDWASGLAENLRKGGEGMFLTFNAACGYDAAQNYMKSEDLLILMAEDPGWVKDIVDTTARLIVETARMMIDGGFRFDGAFLYNDMGYRNGLLFSPEAYMRTHYEADCMMYDFFHSKGMKIILHSCGNVSGLIPRLIEAGLDCLQPLEVKAGMDLAALKEAYGDRLSFMGGIDTRLMSHGDPGRIEEEIRPKFAAAKKGGGYIYHSDHSIPKNVSFQQYKRVLELVREYGKY